MIDVVAALIERDGRFLLCQRPEGKARPLGWEFPGGKIEPGETAGEAIEREIAEELGAAVVAAGAVAETTHAYPDVTVRLTLMACALAGGEPKLLEHRALAWVTLDEAEAYALCPADRELVAQLKAARG